MLSWETVWQNFMLDDLVDKIIWKANTNKNIKTATGSL